EALERPRRRQHLVARGAEARLEALHDEDVCEVGLELEPELDLDPAVAVVLDGDALFHAISDEALALDRELVRLEPVDERVAQHLLQGHGERLPPACLEPRLDGQLQEDVVVAEARMRELLVAEVLDHLDRRLVMHGPGAAVAKLHVLGPEAGELTRAAEAESG